MIIDARCRPPTREFQAVFKGAALSPRSFFHAPWIAWNAPRAVKSDVHGPGLTAIALDVMSGGGGSKGGAIRRPALASHVRNHCLSSLTLA